MICLGIKKKKKKEKEKKTTRFKAVMVMNLSELCS
jgi:hypothetical protein